MGKIGSNGISPSNSFSPLSGSTNDQLQTQRMTIKALILVILVLVVGSSFRRSSDYDSLLEAVAKNHVNAQQVAMERQQEASLSGEEEVPVVKKSKKKKKKKKVGGNVNQDIDLPYVPSDIEAFILNNTEALGWKPRPPNLVTTCNIWQDPKLNPYHKELLTYVKEVEDYYRRLNDFQLEPDVKDLRKHMTGDGPNQEICSMVDLDLNDIFGKSRQLTQTRSGYVEPLLPPMRHHGMCLEDGVTVDPAKYYILMSLQYIVHDWAHICRRMTKTSRTVFIDMGASLRFHSDRDMPSPALALLEQYRKMGIVFDHVYGFEQRQEDPKNVFKVLPEQYRGSFHWINVGVEADPSHRLNPWTLLLENYDEDDFIVVKLDIDTPAIERPLAHQLLKDPRLLKLVDQFYYEHHVNQQELARHWGRTAESVQESFDFFSALRKRGVASHFWV